MKALLVGGKLQGTEIAFLAQEAGWDVTLVDICSHPLAMRLCSETIQAEASSLTSDFLRCFDIVFPAFEDLHDLIELKRACDTAGVPLVFDEQAYRISMSKSATNAFLSNLGIRVPPSIEEADDWGDGFLVKPDSESGSVGAQRFANREEALAFLGTHPSYIGQAFVEGPILSIEVVCDHAGVETYFVTEVVVGEDFDCHRIVASSSLDNSAKQLMADIGASIGRALDMRGIFDVEAVVRDGEAYVLEIDARMPSQTPIAVYYASGVNLVVEVARRFLPEERFAASQNVQALGCAVLQHLKLSDGRLELVGEGALAGSSPLYRSDGTYGADAALLGSDGEEGRFATLITVETNETDALAKLEIALSNAIERGNDL